MNCGLSDFKTLAIIFTIGTIALVIVFSLIHFILKIIIENYFETNKRNKTLTSLFSILISSILIFLAFKNL
jgi:uncharacterized protein HemY